jgi:hypothetical protein
MTTLSSIFTQSLSGVVGGPGGRAVQSFTVASDRRQLVRPSNNIGKGGRGVYFPVDSTLTKIEIFAFGAPTGSPIRVRMKAGLTYANSNSIGIYSLSTTLSITELDVNVIAGNSIFFDIIEVGSSKSGNGLGIRIEFLGG